MGKRNGCCYFKSLSFVVVCHAAIYSGYTVLLQSWGERDTKMEKCLGPWWHCRADKLANPGITLPLNLLYEDTHLCNFKPLYLGLLQLQYLKWYPLFFICKNEINIIALLFTYHSLTVYWEPICAELGMCKWVRQRPTASPVTHAWPLSPSPTKTNIHRESMKNTVKWKEEKYNLYPHYTKTTTNWHFSILPFGLFLKFCILCRCMCIWVHVRKCTHAKNWEDTVVKFISLYHVKHYTHRRKHYHSTCPPCACKNAWIKAINFSS